MTEAQAVGAAYGVDSEVGPLRTVMLHRPGNELRRLTPRNNDKLLFDGIPATSWKLVSSAPTESGALCLLYDRVRS